MENYADGKNVGNEGEKTAGPGILEFYEIIGEELEKEIKELQARIKKVEVHALVPLNIFIFYAHTLISWTRRSRRE